MRRPSLPIFAALATALALVPQVAQAQAAVSSRNSAPVGYAEVVSPGTSSSSSASDTTDAPDATAVIRPPVAASENSSRAFSGVAVAAKFGLAGVGFDVATQLVQQRLNLRGGASFFSYSPGTITTDDLNINGALKFQNADVMVDFFPFRGRFRLSGGATVYNNTGMTATLSVPTGQSFSVGGTDYYSEPYNAVTNPAGPITGSGTFTFGGNKVAPRVTIGTGNMLPSRGRLTFQSEIGFQYFSAPTVVYNISGTGCQNYTAGVYSNCGPIPQSNILSEQQKLQNDLTDLRFFPILSFGLSYRIH